MFPNQSQRRDDFLNTIDTDRFIVIGCPGQGDATATLLHGQLVLGKQILDCPALVRRP